MTGIVAHFYRPRQERQVVLGVLRFPLRRAKRASGQRRGSGDVLVGQYAVAPTQTADGKIDSLALDGLGVSHRAEGTVGKTFKIGGQDGEFTMMRKLTEHPDLAPELAKRHVHTIKGNASLFGLETLAELSIGSKTISGVKTRDSPSWIAKRSRPPGPKRWRYEPS